MRLAPMFTGSSLQTHQKQAPSTQSINFASSSVNARKALTSDVASFSKVHQNQPRFGAWGALHTAVYNSGNQATDELRTELRNATAEKLNEQDEDGCTPLHIAASHGYHIPVRLLLNKSGIDPSIRDFEDNNTPKEMAQAGGHTKAVEEFTHRGL